MVKHARVRRASLRIERADGDRTQVVVADEGAGFDARRALAEGTGGFGLATLQRRIRAVGGTLDVRSGVGGTNVTVRVPLRRFG